jgi:hypothetical protein
MKFVLLRMSVRKANNCHSPILYRSFYLLTPPSELSLLPRPLSSYWPIHAYTILQIVLTALIFIVTLTKVGPIFPIIIILLVPFRLHVMARMWNRDCLRYVDAWACRDGSPEDDEDRKNGILPAGTIPGRNASDIELGEVDRAGARTSHDVVLSRRTSGLSRKSRTLEGL